MKMFLYFTLTMLTLNTLQAEPLADKKDNYKTSCQRTALTFFTDTKEFADNNKAIYSAIMTCKEIMTDLEINKKWDLVKDAKFDGCSDAVRLLIPKGSTEKFEKSQRAKYCAQYMNL